MKLGPLFAAPCFAALLLVSGLTGCRRSSPPPPVTAPAVVVQPVFVDANRLLAFHPDMDRLRQFDQTIARASKRSGVPVIASLRAPAPVTLSLPEPPAPAPEIEAGIDTQRARQAIRDDFEIRRRTRPEQEEDRFRREMERLRRRYLELRREPRPEAAADDLALAIRNARRLSDLLEQLRSLQARPEDRFFYNAAQLRRRQELYRLTEQDLEELRREEAQRLERALQANDAWAKRTDEPPREIPPEEIARVERERDTMRREALAEFDRLEAMRLEIVDRTQLPEPGVTSVRPLEAVDMQPEAATRADVESRVASVESAHPRTPEGDGGPVIAVEALRLQREQLRERLLQEVRALAAAAARARGWSASFTRGSGPDHTAEVGKDVRRLVSATKGGGGIR
ncbi:MAG: hypothetical protein ACO1SX_16820 [Actinomycetota bacterium]